MNCATLRRDLEAGRWPEGPEVEAHLATCETCAEELARQSEAGWAKRGFDPALFDSAVSNPAGGSAETPLDTLFADVERAQEGDRGALGWLRSRPTPARHRAGVAVGLLVVLLCLAGLPRVDWPLYPSSRMSVELGALLMLAALAVGLAFRPLSRPALPQWASLAVALAAGLAAGTVASLSPAHAHHPASLLGAGPDLGARALGCLGFGAVMALAPLGALIALDRRGARDRGPAFLLAVGASLFGFAALQVHCPIVHSEHLWAGHVTVLLATWTLSLVAFELRSRRPV